MDEPADIVGIDPDNRGTAEWLREIADKVERKEIDNIAMAYFEPDGRPSTIYHSRDPIHAVHLLGAVTLVARRLEEYIDTEKREAEK